MWSGLEPGRAAAVGAVRRVAFGVRRPETGFTLFELLVAMVITGVLVAIAGPNLVAAMQAYTLRGAPREIYGQLQQARSSALSHNDRHHWKLVGGSTHEYKLHDDVNGDGVEDAGETVTSYDIQQHHAGVTLSGASTITFTANGSAPANGSITVSAPGGWSAAVTVSPAGRIRIQ